MDRPLSLAALTLLLMVGLLHPACSVEAGETHLVGEKSFSVSSSPDDEVLKVSYTGGMVSARVTFRVFGDGTLEITEASPGGDRTVWNQWRIPLGEERLAREIGSLVEAGVLEFDWGAKAQQIRAGGGVVPVIADMPTTRVSIALESYSGPSNPAGGPFSRTIAIHALMFAARRHPDLPELQALAAIERWLTEAYYAARSGDGSHQK